MVRRDTRARGPGPYEEFENAHLRLQELYAGRVILERNLVAHTQRQYPASACPDLPLAISVPDMA
eukprot:3941206-Rhodomonas_salina.1